MKKRVMKKNTVQGTRRGSKWPPEVKTACMADLLLTDNLTTVAKRHGVPESTLRTWRDEARKEGRDNVWARARQDAVKEIAYKAATGARLNVELLCRRLEAGSRAQEALEEIRGRLRELGPTRKEEPIEITQERVQLMDALTKWNHMSDFAATNILRTLVSVGDRAAAQTGGAENADIQVVLSGEAEELAR